MAREFIYASKFDKKWQQLGLTDDDLRDEKENLSQAERNALKQIVKAIGRELRK